MNSENYPPSQIFIDEPVVYGSFWDRVLAALIDWLVLLVPVYLLEANLRMVTVYDFGYNVRINLLTVIAKWLYSALQESGPSQATVGKRAMGLKVVDSDGERIGFMQASGRYFGKYVSQIILLIGYLMVAWDDKRQALHDKMAGTFVVKR